MRPHGIVFSLPSAGHINPHLHLSKKLVALGFKITFVTDEEQQRKLAASKHPILQQVDLIAISNGSQEQPGENADVGRPSAGLEAVIGLFISTNRLKPALEELIEKMMEQDPVTCIIADAFIPFVQDTANKFGIPRIAFGTTSATIDMLCYHLRKFAANGFIPVTTRTNPAEVIEFVTGMSSLSPNDIPLVFHVDNALIELVGEAYDRLFEADWILSSTFEAMEHGIVQAMQQVYHKRYVPVGPFIPEGYFLEQNQARDANLKPEGHMCLKWLDAHAPASVLYVAFGSLAVLTAEQFMELAYGLEASGQNFLWAKRADFVNDLPDGFMEKFMRRVEKRCYMISWAPQMQILKHSAVGGFLTHCGWNSTLESLCAGVPMIGWPCMSDQNVNCKMAVDQKVAVGLESSRFVRRDEIEKAVRSVMTGVQGADMRKRAQELKEEAKRAVHEGGSSSKFLGEFAEAMRSCQ